MKRLFRNRHKLVLSALLFVFGVVLVKVVAHEYGLETISLNPLFPGIVAANVFLMGFLLSGVLADFKESERIPGELSASIETMADELEILRLSRAAPLAARGLGELRDLTAGMLAWFEKRAETRDVMERVSALNDLFAALDGVMAVNFLFRLRQEQHAIRRLLIRVHAIRETSFVPSGYVISEMVTLFLIGGLVFAKIEPFHESLFFVGLIAFLFVFLGLLIRDLDDPFGYTDPDSSEDVSLKPLEHSLRRLRRLTSPPEAS